MTISLCNAWCNFYGYFSISGTASPTEEYIKEVEEEEMEVSRTPTPSPLCHSPSPPERGEGSNRGKGRGGRGHTPYVRRRFRGGACQKEI